MSSLLAGAQRFRRSAPGSRPALSPRVREALTVVALLPGVALVGAVNSTLASHYGVGKLLFVLAAGLGAALALRGLRVSLLILVVVEAFSFRTTALIGVDFHTSEGVLVVIGLQVLAGLWSGRFQLPSRVVGPLALMFAGATIGAVAGPDMGGALFRLCLVMLPAAAVAIAAAVALTPDRSLAPLIYAVAVALAGTGLVAIYQKSGGSLPGTLDFRGRVAAFFEHPNILGGYVAANILLLVGVTSQAWRRIRLAPLVLLVPIGLGIAALFFTLSRGALVGLAAGVLVVIGLTVSRRQFAPVLALLLLIVVALAVVVPSVPQSQRSALLARFQQLGGPNAESGRSAIFHIAGEAIAAHPLTGVGPLAFGRIMQRSALSQAFVKGATHAHNLVLESFLSLGPIGFAGLILLAGGVVVRLWRTCRRREGTADPLVSGLAIGVLGALASILVQGMFDFLFWQVEMLAFLFLLLGLGYALGSPRVTAGGPDSAVR